jgi:hypothetical protein
MCNISGIHDLGFWILVNEMEYFIPFSEYPLFRNASVSDIFAVRYMPPSQLHWENLDIDIELEALKNPEAFPLVYR